MQANASIPDPRREMSLQLPREKPLPAKTGFDLLAFTCDVVFAANGLIHITRHGGNAEMACLIAGIALIERSLQFGFAAKISIVVRKVAGSRAERSSRVTISASPTSSWSSARRRWTSTSVMV